MILSVSVMSSCVSVMLVMRTTALWFAHWRERMVHVKKCPLGKRGRPSTEFWKDSSIDFEEEIEEGLNDRRNYW